MSPQNKRDGRNSHKDRSTELRQKKVKSSFVNDVQHIQSKATWLYLSQQRASEFK